MAKWTDLRTASDALGVTVSSLKNKLNRGTLDGRKEGKIWLVDLEALQDPTASTDNEILAS